MWEGEFPPEVVFSVEPAIRAAWATIHKSGPSGGVRARSCKKGGGVIFKSCWNISGGGVYLSKITIYA